jgi:hypothetical protein
MVQRAVGGRCKRAAVYSRVVRPRQNPGTLTGVRGKGGDCRIRTYCLSNKAKAGQSLLATTTNPQEASRVEELLSFSRVPVAYVIPPVDLRRHEMPGSFISKQGSKTYYTT